MKYTELLNSRLIGFMTLTEENCEIVEKYFGYDDDVIYHLVLFIGNDILNCKTIALVNDNKDYSWHTNWRIVELPSDIKLEITYGYKSIGENINSIEVNSVSNNVLDSDNINVDMEKWIKAVGEGNWGPKEAANYFYLTIKTNTKILSLGTVYHDCHYPKCIWDFI